MAACLLVFLVWHITARAQLYFETYSPANGLVDARVTKMVQDKNGSLLFLTRDGISVFDGQRIVNYTHFNGKPIGIVNDALVKEDGSLSLACFNGTWLQWDNHKLGLDTLLTAQKIFEVSEIITHPDSRQLIFTNHGLYIYQKQKIEPIDPLQLMIIPFRRTMNRQALTGNRLVVNFNEVNNQKCYLYDLDKPGFLDSIFIGAVNNFHADASGNVFALTNSGTVLFDNEDLQAGNLNPQKPWFHNRVPAGFIAENIFFDKQGKCWLINSQYGCLVMEKNTPGHTPFSSDLGLLPGIRNMFQDREGNYWFIALGKGTQKWVRSNYEPLILPGKRQNDLYYSCLSSDDRSVLVMGAKEMHILRNRNWTTRPFKSSSGTSEAIFYWQNQAWTYTENNTLIDQHSKTYPLAPLPDKRKIPHYPSLHIGFDKYGQVLLSGYKFHLVRKDMSSASISLPYFTDNIVSVDSTYYAFARSNDMIRYELKDGKLVNTLQFISPGLEPRFAIHWNRDTFAVATREKGVCFVVVDAKGPRIVGKINRSNGLSNDFAEVLLRLNPSQIAVGTASGLDVLTVSPEDTLVENISARVGHFEPILQLANDDAGNIYARTEDLRLFKYSPAAIHSSSYHPSAWFSQVLVNDQPVDSGANRYPHTKNNFYFAVSTPSFNDSRQIQFHFTVKGASHQWEQVSNKPDFSVNNLLPGNYSVTVTIRYPGRQYPDQKLSWQFTIKPPFWKTWWFISLVILSIIGSVTVLTRGYYRRRLQKREMELQKQQAIEKERTRIATDMHDDFGASLSRIKFLSEKMQVQQNLEPGLQNDLEKISGYSDEMAEKMGEIVWALNQRYDSVGDLFSFCRSYASEFLADKNISFQFIDGEHGDRQLNGELRRNIFLVMKEALQNIARHSGATEVTIKMNYDKYLYVEIRDNGKGFDWGSIRPFANGLENMKKRMESVGGELKIFNDGGTIIQLQVDPSIHRNTYSDN